MAKLIPLGECVTRGEQRTLEYLQKNLPDDWLVFGNAQVTTGELNREIDAIVVGERCVWVVDEKGLWGVITGDEYRWILSDGSARERVLNQILHAAKMVKGKITAADPRLNQIWVEGLILLSADDVELRVKDARIPRHVWPLLGCEQLFRQAAPAQARPISPSEREAIERLLAGEGVVNRLMRRFMTLGGYRILETMASAPICQTYRAEQERGHDNVLLKVYDLSGLPEAQTREEVRRKAEREYKALYKLRHIPGIVRWAASFQAVEGYGGELYYFAQDLPSSPTLASRLADATWCGEDRLRAARRLCEIIQTIHEGGVIHRNLSPACIFFFRDNHDFQITGFELARLADASSLPSADFPASPYLAPEVTISLHNAKKESDIYSLGIILFEMLSGGVLPFGNRTRQTEDPEPVLSQSDWLKLPVPSPRLKDLEALLQLMVAFTAKDRPSNLGEVLSILDELTTAETPAPIAVGSAIHPLPEGAYLGEFRILQYLGMGGCFHAYRVAKSTDDSQEYVAKVLRYPDLLDTARREFNALSALEHPNIIRAIEVRARADAPYHLLEVYAPGRSVRDIIAKGPIPTSKVAGWAAALAGALAYMETRTTPVYHGDISPRNIILDDERDHPYLIDFGLAYLGEAGREGGIVGTTPYRPPERDVPLAPWPANGDVYSLGLIICELLFRELPYDCSGGQWHKYALKDHLFQAFNLASAEFLQVLRRAVAPEAATRFANAREFQQALADCPEIKAVAEPLRQKRGIVPSLEEVLKVYNRGPCNAENRGMDSGFARLTYVPTELDSQLLPQILDHKYALVILAGNPGDGKTAFLQQLALRLGYSEETLPLHHWVLDRDGWTYECVLDGSAADSGRGLDSDGVLNCLFGALDAAGERSDLATSLKRTQLLAINDGRLLEYIDDHDESGGWVVNHLKRLMLPSEEPDQPHPDIVLVDLNRRSLLAGEPGESTFDTVLEALLEGGSPNRAAGNLWETCRECRAAASCHVRFNMETLRHPILGPRLRHRLYTLLQVIHCRGRLHITMRELRSLMAFLFFGRQTCQQIHEELESPQEGNEESLTVDNRARQRERLYFNRLFATGSAGGRLFEQLSDFDPAQVDNPRFDRLVASALKSSPQSLMSLFESDAGRLPHQAVAISERFSGERITYPGNADLRRWAFFEGRNDALNGVARSGDFWLEMTPFRSITKWVDSLGGFRKGESSLEKALCRKICRGISLTDNVPDTLLDRYLAVRTAVSPKTDLVVVRLFPLEAFNLKWERPAHRAAVFGELPTAMLLHFGEREDPTLEISADLFELLLRFAHGYRLGSAELEGVAAHLELFKNRLLAMPAREVSLLHPTLGSYRARQEIADGTRRIVLEVLS